jgi:hypothetical protein
VKVLKSAFIPSLGQGGQAATEFVVAAVFLLVPLFLIIPLLGKYIDIKHAAIQQARYEAWEYTVWSGPTEHIMTGVDENKSVGRKSFSDTRVEGLRYFFTNPSAQNYGRNVAPLKLNPNWKDHRGDSLFVGKGTAIGKDGMPIDTESRQREHETPGPLGGVFDFVIKFLNYVFSCFGDLLHLVGVKAKFDAMYPEMYFTSEVKLHIRSIDDILPEQSLDKISKHAPTTSLVFETKAAVLTNNWNAGGTDHANQESRGLILTSLLSPISDTVNTVLSRIQKVVNKFPVRTVELPNMPDFGYVADDLLPYEHLEHNSMQLKEKDGVSYYKSSKK